MMNPMLAGGMGNYLQMLNATQRKPGTSRQATRMGSYDNIARAGAIGAAGTSGSRRQSYLNQMGQAGQMAGRAMMGSPMDAMGRANTMQMGGGQMNPLQMQQVRNAQQFQQPDWNSMFGQSMNTADVQANQAAQQAQQPGPLRRMLGGFGGGGLGNFMQTAARGHFARGGGYGF